MILTKLADLRSADGELTGFGLAATASPLLINDLVLTAIQTVIIAAISGLIGALVAHFTKKLIKYFKW